MTMGSMGWTRRTACQMCASLGLLVGCGSAGGESPRDAGEEIDTFVPTIDASTVMARAPEIPWLAEGVPPVAAPVLTPCADGWHEIELEGGELICEPWPTTGAADCPAGAAHFPGEPGCASVGTDCPSDGWPTDLPADRPLLHVRAGAAAGGDGTRGSPFSTLEAAVGTADVVVPIASGRYDETVQLAAGVTLWGACASGTVITASAPGTAEGVIVVALGDGGLRNLSIVDAGVRAVFVRGGAAAVIRDVALEGNYGAGVYAEGAGTHIRLESVVSRAHLMGAPRAGFGYGVFAEEADAELDRVVLSGNGMAGLVVWGNGGTVTVDRTAINDTQEGSWGMGLLVRGYPARLDVRRSAVEDNGNSNIGHIGGDDPGARFQVTVEDTVIRRARSTSRNLPYGLELRSHVDARVSRALLDENQNAGIALAGFSTGSTLTLEDVVVRRTLTGALSSNGHGLLVNSEGQLTARRTVIDDCEAAGVAVAGVGTAVRLEDTVVRNTKATSFNGTMGHALLMEDGARAELVRVILERSRSSAISARGVLTLEDVAIRETQSNVGTGVNGHGIFAAASAAVDAQRVLFHANREVGIFLTGRGTWARLSEVVVRETEEAACAVDLCPGQGAGVGIGAYSQATAEITGFAVMDNVFMGLQLATGGEVDLAGGEVSGHPVGVNVQTSDFDLMRLQNGVRYVDNERNLDTRELSIPQPFAP